MAILAIIFWPLAGGSALDMSDKEKPRARGADSQPGQLLKHLAQGLEMFAS